MLSIEAQEIVQREKIKESSLEGYKEADIRQADVFGRMERHIIVIFYLMARLYDVKIIKRKTLDRHFKYFIVGEKENVQSSILYYKRITEQLKEAVKLYLSTVKERDQKKTMKIRHAFSVGYLHALDYARQGNADHKTCPKLSRELFEKKDADIIYMKKGMIAGFDSLK